MCIRDRVYIDRFPSRNLSNYLNWTVKETVKLVRHVLQSSYFESSLVKIKLTNTGVNQDELIVECGLFQYFLLFNIIPYPEIEHRLPNETWSDWYCWVTALT